VYCTSCIKSVFNIEVFKQHSSSQVLTFTVYVDFEQLYTKGQLYFIMVDFDGVSAARMGHVNSSQGQPPERCVNQPDVSLDFETDANMVHKDSHYNDVHNTTTRPPKLDMCKLNMVTGTFDI
jgi:hypothetical protein